MVGMEGPLRPANHPASPPAPLPGAGDDAPVVVLREGQRLRAAVSALPGDGRVRLGAFGVVFDARTSAALELGKTYEFEVLATQPVLRLAPRVGPWGPQGGSGANWFPGGALSPQLLAAMAEVGGDLSPSRVDGPRRADLLAHPPGSTPVIGPAVRAEDLAAARGCLGHDLEARVLRLALRTAARGGAVSGDPDPAHGEATALRSTLKAQALAALAAGGGGGAAERPAAEQLVRWLGGVERDNAARAELDVPQWWPLMTTGDLREARVFERPASAEEGDPSEFHAVLLLDFTELGAVRADIAVDGQRVRANLCVVEELALTRLVPAMQHLRQAMEAVGLEVGELAVRRAPGAQLPVADLKLPAVGGEGGLDVRA